MQLGRDCMSNTSCVIPRWDVTAKTPRVKKMVSLLSLSLMRNAKSGGDGGAAINGSTWDVMKTSPCIQDAETLPIPMDLNTSLGNCSAPV